MNNYVIVTDSGTDFSDELVKECDVVRLELSILIEGEEPKPNNEVSIPRFFISLFSFQILYFHYF